jgi:hypothetical protein
MPARHKGFRAICFSRSRFNPEAQVDERGCRRDIRSSGWIEFSFSKTGPVEETSFLRSVRIDCSAVSPGPKPGRDLVLTCSPTPSFHLPGRARLFHFPNPDPPTVHAGGFFWPRRSRSACRLQPRKLQARRAVRGWVGLRLQTVSRWRHFDAALSSMVIASRNAKVNRN